MSAEIIQSKYEELEAIARRFAQQAQGTRDLQRRVQRGVVALHNGGWEGRGVAAFSGEMEQKVFPAMQRLADALAEAQATTLQVKEIIQKAEEEASLPFRGNGMQAISDNYPTSQLSMSIPQGGLPPRPQPPPPPLQGDGSVSHDSEERNWFERRYDDAVEALFNRIADGADAMGMDNAARHMRHYLGNSGQELDISPVSMLRDLPGMREKANQSFEYDLLPAINERIEKEYTGQPMRFPVTTDWQGYYAQKQESQDWFYALGGFSFAHTADVIVTPNPDGTAHVEIQHQLHVFDRYNWDKGKGVDILGVRVGDEQLSHLHEAGVAQEFEVWGKSHPQSYSYNYDHGSSGINTGPQPWNEGSLNEPSPDRTTREGREQSRSPRRDDPTRNNDRERV